MLVRISAGILRSQPNLVSHLPVAGMTLPADPPIETDLTIENLPAGLILIHGNRAEALRDLLVAWMKQHPLSPLETETVLVQSNGVADRKSVV